MNDSQTSDAQTIANKNAEFEKQASESSGSVVSELFGFLWANKAWWLAPIVVMLLLVGVLIFLGGTVAAPFIYTLF